MAELEKETETTEQEIDEVETETQDDVDTDNVDTITYEQALEWKKKAENLAKAEKRIEILKKQVKVSKADKPDDVRAILAREKFFDKNPDAEKYRKEIEKLEEKWLSTEDAYYLASKEDREVDKQREVYWKSFVWDNWWDSFALVSVKEFDSMTVEKQNEYVEKTSSKHWGVKFK